MDMKTKIFSLLVVVASLHCRADSRLAQTNVFIGQPSIFWLNGQWQTYNDGVWTPYGQPVSSHPARPHSKEGKADSGPGIGDPGIVRDAGRRKSTGLSGESNARTGPTTIGISQSNGIGQSTGGIGKPNVGIGRNAIGIGKPSLSIGGSTNGIGQPNGISQTTIGIGKPASLPKQQRSSPLDTTK
jgi:hypothetical protein